MALIGGFYIAVDLDATCSISVSPLGIDVFVRHRFSADVLGTGMGNCLFGCRFCDRESKVKNFDFLLD